MTASRRDRWVWLPRAGLRAGLVSALVSLMVSFVVVGVANGQTITTPRKPSRPPPPATNDGGSDSDGPTVSGIDVVAKPLDYSKQPGAVIGDIKPEIQLSPADIQSYGVSTVTDLLSELAPETRSDRGRGGESPVVLLNGRRISSLNEIMSIPTEAIQRVDILPEEVSLKYGYSADQRVVNIVLRRRFRATTAELEGGAPTEGGEAIGQAELDLLHIRRDDRLNLDLKYKGATGITDADRDIIEPTPANGGPAQVAGDRSLLPSSQSLTANAVLAHPIGAGINATLNGTLGATRSVSLQGLPEEGLDGVADYPPSDAPAAPSALTPLRQYVDGWTAHLGSTLNKDLAGWRLSLTNAYDHADTQTDTDTGIAPGLQSYARSISDSANIQVLANGPLVNLPAGAFYVSAKAGDTQSWLGSTTDRLGEGRSVSLSRNDANGQINVDLPLTSRRNHILPFFGDFSLNANASVDQLSDYGTLKALGFGLSWTPIPGYTLIVSHTNDQAAPTIQQLGGAAIFTPGVRVFDYATGRTVDVTQVTGGSRGLVADNRNVLKIGLTVKPLQGKDLTITANYIRSDIDHPVATFPAASAQIEAAFPSRFLRDAEGDLIEEDLRPVNFSSSQRGEIRWGINYSRQIGKTPPRSAERRAFFAAAAEAMRARGEGPPGQAGSTPDGGSPPPASGPPGPGAGGGSGSGGLDPGRARGATGGFGGPGGGGGGRGGGFGGGGGSAGRLQFAVYHTLYLVDRQRVGPAGPTLDLLGGAPASGTGGQYRNEIEGQLGFTMAGYGARLSADWRGATVVQGMPGVPTGDLHFSDVTLLNLRLFDNFGQQRSLVKRHPWLRGARLTVSVVNLLDQRVEVRNGAGVTPLSYQPGYIDPTGRTVMISLRKLFF